MIEETLEEMSERLKAKNRDAVRKSRERAKQRAEKFFSPAGQAAELRRIATEKWRANYQKMTPAEKQAMEAARKEWNFVHRLMRDTITHISTGQPYGEDSVYPEQAFLEVEAFARKFPPPEGNAFYDGISACFREVKEGQPDPPTLSNYGTYAVLLGLPTSCTDASLYRRFLEHFEQWYQQHRHDAQFAKDNWAENANDTWDEVDEAIKRNARLGRLTPARSKGSKEHDA